MNEEDFSPEQKRLLEIVLNQPSDVLLRRNDNNQLLIKTYKNCLDVLEDYKKGGSKLDEEIERFKKRIKVCEAENNIRNFVLRYRENQR